MKIFILLIIYSASLFFISCDQPLEEELPYFPKIVVRGIIEEGTGVKDLYIGRTVPVLYEYSSSFGNLTDAVAVIVHDTIFYPLYHTKNGLYRNDTIPVMAGEKYSLLVRWDDKSVSAETIVPVPAVMERFTVASRTENEKTIRVLQTYVMPFGDASYTATWVLTDIAGTIINESKTFFEVKTARGNQSSPILIQTDEVPAVLILNNLERIGMRVYSFDKAFYDYFISRNINQVSDPIFGQVNTNIRWNIKGDGIGIFIGRKDVVLRYEQ